MDLVYFGTSSFGLPALEALSRAGHRWLAIVTFPDKPSGRDLVPKPPAVKRWAQSHSLKILEMSNAGEKSCLEELRALAPDLFIVISFGWLLKKNYLELPRLGALNVHASLLPSYRGASPMQSALLNGDKETGVSVLRMTEALDAGDVLLSKSVPVDERETILTLEPKLSGLAAEALLEALSRIETGKASWTPQDPKKVSTCTKIRKEDGRIRWTDSAVEIDRRVRAFLSWPGSFTFLGGKRLLIKKTHVEPALVAEKPGQVTKLSPESITVSTGRALLAVEELQLEGRNAMKAADFLKGSSLRAGDFFV